MAESISERRAVKAKIDGDAQAAMAAAEEEKYRFLASAHPEFSEVLLKREPERVKAMQQDMAAWIDTLPYKDGARCARILQSGSPTEVSEVLGMFKEAVLAAVREKDARQRQDRVRSDAADAGFAVPSKARPAPQSQPSKDDYDAAYDEE